MSSCIEENNTSTASYKKLFMCSGGKDSVASIILDYLYEKHIDNTDKGEIIFSEVMYDLKRNISGENPEHIDFIYNVLKPTVEKWGYKFTVIRGEKDYLDLFYHVMERSTKHPEHIGMKYGFPVFGLCSVKRDCKINPMDKYVRSIKEPFIQILGIAIDEQKRLKSMHKKENNISLLEKYAYTEEMAKELCIKYNLLSPTYTLSNRYPILLPSGKFEKSSRGGCWFCPNAKYCEHAELRKNNPELWNEFLKLEHEDVAFDKWNVFGTSLAEREKFLNSINY